MLDFLNMIKLFRQYFRENAKTLEIMTEISRLKQRCYIISQTKQAKIKNFSTFVHEIIEISFKEWQPDVKP